MTYAEVIGDPIVQSKSPVIHKFWLGKLGVAADYRACHVSAAGLADYFAARRSDSDWRGCNITMPHKQAAIALVDRVDPLAARIGAINTVVRSADGELTGYNTDAAGFLEPLQPLLAEKHLVRMARVVGAGGAARAIIAALADHHFTLVLAARDPAKARALLDELVPGGEPHTPPLSQIAPPTDFARQVEALRPQLILADEPTGQLDEATAQRALESLLDAVSGSDAALVVTTHDPAVAARLKTIWKMDFGLLTLPPSGRAP